jgi:hypothetical protein
MLEIVIGLLCSNILIIENLLTGKESLELIYNFLCLKAAVCGHKKIFIWKTACLFLCKPLW